MGVRRTWSSALSEVTLSEQGVCEHVAQGFDTWVLSFEIPQPELPYYRHRGAFWLPFGFTVFHDTIVTI